MKTLAVISVILGVLSLLGAFTIVGTIFAFLPAIVGIIFAIVALFDKKAKKTAMGGLVIGIVALLVAIFMLFILGLSTKSEQEAKNTIANSTISEIIHKDTPKDIFQNISPAVVYITTQRLGGEDYLGSGFIVDSSGIVITNAHVVQSARSINVKLKDGRTFPATHIVYHDTNRDICILKINADNLSTATLGDSNTISIGEPVYCIGNPLGLEYSFSDGLLSGIRDFRYLKWFQFTAPVSPGNSGGPLVDSLGQVIGVVTFVAESGQNLNFALAVNEVKPYISTILQMTFQEFVSQISQAEYYLLQGHNYAMQDDYDQAIVSYKKALEINSNNYDAHASLAQVYFNLQDYSKGIFYFQKALQINPNAQDYAFIGFVYLGSGQPKEAIPYLLKAIELNPQDASSCSALGGSYFFLGQFKEAILYLEKAIQINPNDAQLYTNLASCYTFLKQYQKAISYCEQAIQIDPNHEDTYTHLSDVYCKLQKFQDSIAYAQKALQINPNGAHTYVCLGQVYLALGQFKKGDSYLQKALEINFATIGSLVYEIYGKYYYELGQFEKAKENLQKAKELYHAQGIYMNVQEIEELLNKIPSTKRGKIKRDSTDIAIA